MLLQLRGMRRAVGAEEELRRARGGGGHQRQAMLLALEHRQAVVVRPHAAQEDGVAVEQQVVRGDRRRQVLVARGHVLRRLARGDVLEHDLQPGEVAPQRLQHAVDEHRLAVEQVDVGIGDLAMHQQQQAFALHRLQRGVGLADVGDAGIAVGRRAGRVQLDAPRRRPRARGAISSGGVRSVRYSVISGSKSAPAGSASRMRRAVGQRQRGGGHRRLQVGHDDGARELPRGVRQHGAQRIAVAQMQVPVVGAGQRQRLSCRIVAALLQPPHLGIAPAARQQLGMRAALDHAALLQHDDLMRIDHRATAGAR